MGLIFGHIFSRKKRLEIDRYTCPRLSKDFYGRHYIVWGYVDLFSAFALFQHEIFNIGWEKRTHLHLTLWYIMRYLLPKSFQTLGVAQTVVLPTWASRPFVLCYGQPAGINRCSISSRNIYPPGRKRNVPLWGPIEFSFNLLYTSISTPKPTGFIWGGGADKTVL